MQIDLFLEVVSFQRQIFSYAAIMSSSNHFYSNINDGIYLYAIIGDDIIEFIESGMRKRKVVICWTPSLSLPLFLSLWLSFQYDARILKEDNILMSTYIYTYMRWVYGQTHSTKCFHRQTTSSWPTSPLQGSFRHRYRFRTPNTEEFLFPLVKVIHQNTL